MNHLWHWVVVSSLSLLMVLGAGHLQAADGAADNLPKDFLGLADLRVELSARMQTLKSEIAVLEKVPSDTIAFRAELDRLTKEVADLERRPTLTAIDQDKLAGDKKQIQSLNVDIGESEARQKTLAEKRTELLEKQTLADQVRTKIAKMLSPDQQFKLWASVVFALLIGLVIAGFFTISWRDKQILQAIFSGQAGLQFLTLFSLVIAIILFGIMGILEGKELSALLGGLSGYILGRGISTRQEAQHPPA
jgi:PBP1b-binding outer membrane lipoprotein LpoB